MNETRELKGPPPLAVAEKAYAATVIPDGRPVPFGRYTLLRALGSGAMGAVMLAEDSEIRRQVALKLLLPQDVVLGGYERFIREARALGMVKHPNVVTIHDVGDHGGQAYIAMEYIAGRTLKEWLAEESPTWERIVEVYMAAGEGLAAAHDAGLIHRDFKPANVIVGDDGRVVVVDFGLARREHDKKTHGGSLVEDDPLRRLTETGMQLGTPAYMAPEAMLGGPLDARCDQFGFCAALFEAVYGKRPFGGGAVGEIMRRLIDNEVEPADPSSGVPRRLHAVLSRGLAIDPDRRFPSMRDLLDALAHAREPRQRSRVPLYVVAAVVGAAAVAAIMLTPRAADEPVPVQPPQAAPVVPTPAPMIEPRDPGRATSEAAVAAEPVVEPPSVAEPDEPGTTAEATSGHPPTSRRRSRRRGAKPEPAAEDPPAPVNEPAPAETGAPSDHRRRAAPELVDPFDRDRRGDP